jgi:radical SAM protein with 4Fe4S-binding SPASM domain
MITESPTFCPAPWTSLNIDQTGRVSPCMCCLDSVGNIKETSIQEVIHGPILTDMREHMARGEWHPACNGCKQLEETTGTSGRTVRQATSNTLAAIDLDPANFFELEHVVINWSNLCNLTCVYCNPETSTAWQNIKGIPINHVKNEHPDLIELAREHGHTVVGLTLGGGEPLLQKGLLDFLRCLNPEQVRVLVTTNLSVDISNNPIYNELRTWKNVDWQISFDNANKEKFEYVRAGASWEMFINNIRLMKQHKQHIMAHPAYSIYCAFDLVEYYEFCVTEELDMYWCDLTHPWDLDIRRLNKHIRELAVVEINTILDKYQTSTHLAIDTLKGYRANLLDNSYIFNIDGPDKYKADPIGYSRRVEQELKTTNTFEQLWPELTKLLYETHYV